MVSKSFFDRDASLVARELLGKVIHHKYKSIWLSAQIIETESYYLSEKGSHASLGITEKRKALFMPPGTIYMYYARGKDSFNVSTKGAGNAVLIKSGIPYLGAKNYEEMINVMKQLNPKNNRERETMRLCSGQTLLCKSLGLKVTDWDKGSFSKDELSIEASGYNPDKIIQTRRLGIPKGRDEHLMNRFVDYEFSKYATEDILVKKRLIKGKDYIIHIG